MNFHFLHFYILIIPVLKSYEKEFLEAARTGNIDKMYDLLNRGVEPDLKTEVS